MGRWGVLCSTRHFEGETAYKPEQSLSNHTAWMAGTSLSPSTQSIWHMLSETDGYSRIKYELCLSFQFILFFNSKLDFFQFK